MGALVAGCGGGPPPPPAPASPSAVGSAPASASAPPVPATVRLALDWTPNTDHTGFFVANHEGWYRDAGITLRVLPYSGTTPETLLGAHQAECGISFQDSMTFAVAAGVKIKSVMAILQRSASEIAVLDSSPIKRPRDLDGKTYGGVGAPHQGPANRLSIPRGRGQGGVQKQAMQTAPRRR